MARPISITSRIRRLISGLALGQMFSTRQCLDFGPRAAVDQALFRMVHRGEIVRLAWGVFTKAKHTTQLPTLYEVAVFKAKAFGRRVLQMPRQSNDPNRAFDYETKPTPLATDGASSSFRVFNQRIVLKRRSLRKCMQGDTKHGLVTRALWFFGRENVTSRLVELTMRDLGRRERDLIKKSCAVMPAWLADIVVWGEEEWATRLPPPRTA